jgi:UDP-2,3-diacylglucosamine pyrophosphatase LpxH
LGRIETVVLSDIHLTEAEETDPRRPLWMSHKRRVHFVDADFVRLCEHVLEQARGPVELVLNGDIFDFDAVVKLPEQAPGEVDWLARLRGLSSEEWMSLYKMECILADHPDFVACLARFIRRGGRVVFVVGNHDAELLWPSVQQRVREAIGANGTSGERPVGAVDIDDRVVFCSWFYLSDGDTFVSHGHQFDPHCVLETPIDPLISVRGKPRVRIPFGDVAARYMMNGMGYFNPHATENYIKQSAWSYARFWARHMLRTQPLMIWTWFWGAMATLLIALRDHWSSPMRDPLTVDAKVRDIARASNATSSMVRSLDALIVPSACRNPLRIMRELWLDRALLFLGALFAAWQIILTVNVASPVSPWWVVVPLGVLLPPYFYWARSVHPTVFKHPLLTEERAELIATITGARRVVFGHVHVPEMKAIGPVSYINGGFWSPAFSEPDCKQRIGTQTFVWIRPTADGGRSADLLEWPPGGRVPRAFAPAETLPVPEPAALPVVTDLYRSRT